MEFPYLKVPLQPKINRDPFHVIDPSTEPERFQLLEIIKERMNSERKRKADNIDDYYIEYGTDESKGYEPDDEFPNWHQCPICDTYGCRKEHELGEGMDIDL